MNAALPTILVVEDNEAIRLLIAAALEDDGSVVTASNAADASHTLDSASESLWGLAAVAADADGVIDLDEPVAFTIGEFAAHPSKSNIRVRQLLHLTSGLAPGTATLRRDRTPDLTARALTRGRVHVGYEDIEALARPVLRHRLLRNFHAEAEGVTVPDLLEGLVADLL